nr:palindromic element RPE4 domain-containing protein [Rickettsia tamurae]
MVFMDPVVKPRYDSKKFGFLLSQE